MTHACTDQPRLGAAHATQRSASGVRVFGVVSTDGTAAGLVPVTQRMASRGTPCAAGEHLWMVGSTVTERLRWSAVPIEPPELLGGGPPPPSRSVMRLRIHTTDSSRGMSYEIDLGQSLELYAERLQIDVLAPEGAVALGGGPVVPRAGLVFHAECLVRTLRLEVSRGASSAQLTETVHVPPNQGHVHRVPTAARSLTAYAEPLPAPPVCRWLRGDPPAMAVPLGTVAWSIDRPRMEITVPSATHLRIEPEAAARTFTLVWTIAP